MFAFKLAIFQNFSRFFWHFSEFLKKLNFDLTFGAEFKYFKKQKSNKNIKYIFKILWPFRYFNEKKNLFFGNLNQNGR